MATVMKSLFKEENMAFFIEFARIIIVICCVIFFSACVHLALSLWQVFPIEEEKSTPVYITKELYK